MIYVLLFNIFFYLVSFSRAQNIDTKPFPNFYDKSIILIIGIALLFCIIIIVYWSYSYQCSQLFNFLYKAMNYFCICSENFLIKKKV